MLPLHWMRNKNSLTQRGKDEAKANFTKKDGFTIACHCVTAFKKIVLHRMLHNSTTMFWSHGPAKVVVRLMGSTLA